MDVVFLLLLFYLVFNGLYKGFSGFLLKSFGLFLGLYLAIPTYKVISPFLSTMFSGAFFLIDFLSFITVVVFILSTFLIAEKFVKKKLYRKKAVVITDRLLGGLLGFVVFILLLIILVKFESHNVIVDRLLSDSKIVELFKRI